MTPQSLSLFVQKVRWFRISGRRLPCVPMQPRESQFQLPKARFHFRESTLDVRLA